MSERERVVVGWSAGKDSALALHEVRARGEVEPVALLTTVTEDFDRVSMHGVCSELVGRQAASLGISLEKVGIPKGASNAQYEERLFAALGPHRRAGVERVVFGDLFLEDVRAYREQSLGRIGMRGLYPIWGRDTSALVRELIALGFRAIVVCVDPRRLDRSFVGRWVDDAFLADLPADVDPCGENGEFHTFVVDGPGFSEPVAIAKGRVVERDGFVFCDLVPA